MSSNQNNNSHYQSEKNPDAINLSSLVLGFSSAALSYFSEEADETSLKLAEQNISIVEMLKERTQSTLTSEETKLFDDVLADLHLKYAEAVSKLGNSVHVSPKK